MVSGMSQSRYVVHIAPLLGPEGATLYEIELRPPGPRPPGSVSEDTVRTIIRDERDAAPGLVMVKARARLRAAADGEWSIET
jgi:hypothetical protein